MENEQAIKTLGMYLEDDFLRSEQLISENEEKSAQMILDALEGHYIIRAEKILDYCKLAIKLRKL